MYHTTVETNCPLSEVVSMSEMAASQHTLEEGGGDKLVALNAQESTTILHVFSVDTDVFVLISHFP